MQPLLFFQQHPPSETEVVELKDASPEHLDFANAVLEVFDPIARKWEFTRQETRVTELYTQIRFLKENQGFTIVASTDDQDRPSNYNVILDGRHPREGNWYSFALWRLMRDAGVKAYATEYAFPTRENITPSLEVAANDLLRFGRSFLEGDLQLFEMSRRK